MVDTVGAEARGFLEQATVPEGDTDVVLLLVAGKGEGDRWASANEEWRAQDTTRPGEEVQKREDGGGGRPLHVEDRRRWEFAASQQADVRNVQKLPRAVRVATPPSEEEQAVVGVPMFRGTTIFFYALRPWS